MPREEWFLQRLCFHREHTTEGQEETLEVSDTVESSKMSNTSSDQNHMILCGCLDNSDRGKGVSVIVNIIVTTLPV